MLSVNRWVKHYKARKTEEKLEGPQVLWGDWFYPMTYGMCGDLNHDPMTITAREIPEPNCQGVLGVGL